VRQRSAFSFQQSAKSNPGYRDYQAIENGFWGYPECSEGYRSVRFFRFPSPCTEKPFVDLMGGQAGLSLQKNIRLLAA
jgi:hypothetical protein